MDGLVEADTGIQEQLFTVITAGVVCQMGNLHRVRNWKTIINPLWVLVWNAMNKTFYGQTHVLLDKQVSEEHEVI